jgi:hypothetical protein
MTSNRRYLTLAAVLLVGLGLRLAALSVSAPTDDACITFRYAENLAAGHGFVYNTGERVLGTTTPLFTLLLLPFALAGLPLQAVAYALALAADLLVCLFLYRLIARPFGEPAALLAAFFYALSYVGIAACGYGMETQVFEALVVTAILLMVQSRYTATAVAAGLAVLARPEGALLAGILAAFVLAKVHRQRLPFPWKALVGFLAVTAPWFFFATVYFGSPFPNSVLAKLIQQNSTPRQLLDFFVLRNPVVSILWVGAVVGAIAGIRKRSVAVAALAAWVVVYMVFFLVSQPPFLGGWYFPPLVLGLVCLSAVAASWALGSIMRSAARGAVVAALLFATADAFILPRSFATARWHRQAVDNVYRPLGRWARDETRASEVIDAADIGYLGFISRRTILDAAALVTPDVWRHYVEHRGSPDWDVSFILTRRPDFVVLPIRGNVYRRFTGSDFPAQYEPVRRFQAEGLTDLHPSPDIAERYASGKRFVADYIVYKRRR